MVRSATRNFCFLPETLSPACGQTAAALGPFRRGAFIDRSPGFHSGTACPCPPILCISAMVSARFRLIAPLASWTCAPRSRLWIVATVQSQQPSANQRVRNLHHEGTVSRRHALYSPSGGIVLDLLGCISARVLQCEGTLFLSRTGAGSLQRSRHRGAPYPHHSRGGKRVASAFPLLRTSRRELTPQTWCLHHGSPHPSTVGTKPRPGPPACWQGLGDGQALHWPVTTALIQEPLSA